MKHLAFIVGLLAVPTYGYALVYQVEQPKPIEAKVVEAVQAPVDPCGLKDVVCPNEEAKAPPVTTQGAKKAPLKAIRATGSNLVEITCYTGLESNGANGRKDGISVATYRYPQGTWIDIEGIGKRRVDTVTARRFSNRIDVWFGSTKKDWERCIEFGKQYLEVKVVQ